MNGQNKQRTQRDIGRPGCRCWTVSWLLPVPLQFILVASHRVSLSVTVVGLFSERDLHATNLSAENVRGVRAGASRIGELQYEVQNPAQHFLRLNYRTTQFLPIGNMRPIARSRPGLLTKNRRISASARLPHEQSRWAEISNSIGPVSWGVRNEGVSLDS